MIVVNNTSGNPMLIIENDGTLWKANAKGEPERRVGFVHVESLGFDLCYKRRDLAGGTVWLYQRNDGTRLRRHEDANDRVWWDTGETVATAGDIDAVRRDLAKGAAV